MSNFMRRFQAKGRLKTGQMNKTEESYSKYLEDLKHARAIAWWKFEGVKLRLADNTFFTVDFAVLNFSQELEMHEVKPRSGDSYFCMDDAKMKIKIAADMYPFKFLIAYPVKGGGWATEEF
jgi:hypothetical protein